MLEITDKRAYDKKAIKRWVENNPELIDNRLVVVLRVMDGMMIERIY